uniref:Uncharacterized protein n=1 Tax=Sus scrofa TaxID=9823 RepID=A0A8D1TD80_PIG
RLEDCTAWVCPSRCCNYSFNKYLAKSVLRICSVHVSLKESPFSSTYTLLESTQYSCRFSVPLSPLGKLLTQPNPKTLPPKAGDYPCKGGDALYRSPHRGGPGAHAQRAQRGLALQVLNPVLVGGPRSSKADCAVGELPVRFWEVGARDDGVASGTGGHTHNFSIHSPSNTSVQLEAVMGRTRLRSSGTAACSEPASASAAAAATQAARSAASSVPRRPPTMSGRGTRLHDRSAGKRRGGPADPAFPGSANGGQHAQPPPTRADRPSFR